MTFANSLYNTPKEIKSLGEGWYSFKDIPQEHRYIKIHALNCGNDKKAMKTAKQINPAFDYIISTN